MKINILRRLEAIESKVKATCVPDLIMILYDWGKEQWCIKESYFEKQKEIKKFMQHYKDYVIPSEYDGTIILNLLDCPKEFQCDLFSFKASDVRKECQAEKNAAFTIENHFREGKGIETKFDISIIHYASE